MTDRVEAVQAAALDRTLVAGDATVARRHLALVAVLDGLREDHGSADRLATAAATLLAVRAVTRAPSGAGRPVVPPAPTAPDSPTPGSADVARLAADGAAVADRRFDVPLDRIATRADLSTAAVRAARARRRPPHPHSL